MGERRESEPSLATPLSVLFVDHRVALDEAQQSLLALMAAIDRSRFQPHLACPADGALPAAANAIGVTVHTLPRRLEPGWRGGLGVLTAARALRDVVKRHGIGLVHGHGQVAAACAVLAMRRLAAPTVWHAREVTGSRLATIMARRASSRLASSTPAARALQCDGTTIVHDGVAATYFEQPAARAAVRAEFRLAPGTRLVAAVGDIVPGSGHRVLVDAAAWLRRSRNDTVFLVIGDSPWAAHRLELDTAVRNMRLGERVRCLGRRSDRARLLAACDVLAHPAQHVDSFARAIAEAQAVGLPVVAADVMGVSDLIDDRVNGFAVQPGDPAALAARIADLLDNDAMRRRMGCAARARARHSWTMRAHAHAIERVWLDTLLRIPAATAG